MINAVVGIIQVFIEVKTLG